MDGVLVDYSKGWRNSADSLKYDVGVDNPDVIANIISRRALNPEFWAKLEWATGGQELWAKSNVLFRHVHILTSTAAYDNIEKHNAIKEGKLEWIRTHIHPHLTPDKIHIVTSGAEKSNYADDLAILVDDRETTIKAFNARGGYGIHHNASKYGKTVDELILMASEKYGNIEEFRNSRSLISRRRLGEGKNDNMDEALNKLITETINKTFAKAPEKLIERGVREIQYDICPHCKTEIHEKHEYTEDGGTTWRHSDCGGLIARPVTPLEEVSSWLQPYVKEARAQRNEIRREMGLAELPDDEPGGTMSAVNTTTLANEAPKKPSLNKERTEEKPVETYGHARFFDETLIVANRSRNSVKATATEFDSDVDNQRGKILVLLHDMK